MHPRLKLLLPALLTTLLTPAIYAAPRLVLSTTALTPPRISPGSVGQPQSVEALNAGDGTLSLTVSASAPWLSATVGAAKACTILSGTCNPINISLNTTSLVAGAYTAYIGVSDPNAVDSPQYISVTITVAAVPDSVTLYVSPNGTGDSTALSYIYPASKVTGTVATQSGGSWLSFIPSGSNPLVNLPNTIQVAAQPGQAAGTYTGTVTIAGSTLPADNKAIAVTLVVTTAPIVDTSDYSTTRFYSFAGGDKPYPATLTFSSAGSSALNITAATSSQPFLTATASGNTITMTADPASLAAGTYLANVTLTSNAANNARISIPVEFVVYPVGPSIISAGGIVNAATYASESFSPGDIVAAFGTQMAPAGTAAVNPGLPPLATQLGNVQVLVNGAPAPLYFTSPKQVNFQIPYSLPPGQSATVQVASNGVPGNKRSINIVANAPRLLVTAGNYGIVANATDGSFALPPTITIPPYTSHPAKPGDVLVFYAIGLGQTSPAATEGKAANTSPLQNAPTTNVTFGGQFCCGVPVTVAAPFAGLTPGAVGLYQINVAIPANSQLNVAVPVSVNINGASSNTVLVAISANGK